MNNNFSEKFDFSLGRTSFRFLIIIVPALVFLCCSDSQTNVESDGLCDFFNYNYNGKSSDTFILKNGKNEYKVKYNKVKNSLYNVDDPQESVFVFCLPEYISLQNTGGNEPFFKGYRGELTLYGVRVISTGEELLKSEDEGTGEIVYIKRVE